MSSTLTVCAEMVFTDLTLVERVHRIHDRGFACEIWGWTDKDAAAPTLAQAQEQGLLPAYDACVAYRRSLS